MKNVFKNKAVSIIILIATVILAGVAIFTAYRLYQLRQEAVAPNAPTSEPAAATSGAPGGAVFSQCTALTFSLTPPASNPPSVCGLTINPNTLTLNVGQKAIVTITATGVTGTINYTPVDTTVISVVKKSNTSFEVTALKAGSSKINITISSDPTCLTDITVTVPSENQSPTPTPTPPASCNNSCNTNSDCESGLVCSNGSCKNSSCTADSDCVCASATPTPSTSSSGGTVSQSSPTPTPSLPDAGVGTPTIVGAGVGILLILGAILIAL